MWQSRRQSQGIQGKKSNWSSISSSVPQGSVLEPTLFVVLINNINENIKSDILKFADDIKIFETASNKKEIKSAAEKFKKAL